MVKQAKTRQRWLNDHFIGVAKTANSMETLLEKSPNESQKREAKMGASCIPQLYMRDLIRKEFAEAPI